VNETADSRSSVTTSERGRISDEVCGDEHTPERHRLRVAAANPRPRDVDGDRRQRTTQVLVRLSPAEAESARRLAEANDLTVPALLRAGLHHFTALEAP
jgi:hypothetical protein